MSGREQQRIAEVFASNWVAPVGPHLTDFEQQFARRIGVAHAAAVVSGTAALHLALRRLQLTPADEVLCSTFTFCASANPIVYEQAQPVFLDADQVSWNMDPNLLEEELTDAARRGRLPKAIVVVDILGQSADMDPILQLAARYGVPVIEDAAEALGATYKGHEVGAAAWASVFSFNGNKIITTSGGGMLCSNDEALIERAKFWATQAKEPGPLYLHKDLGYNYRLSNVLAAIGLAQLEVLDERVAARQHVFEYYQKRLSALPGVRFLPLAPYGQAELLADRDPHRTRPVWSQLRRRASGAGTAEHRIPPRVGAAASATHVCPLSLSRGGRRRGDLCRQPLPAQRIRPQRLRPRPYHVAHRGGMPAPLSRPCDSRPPTTTAATGRHRSTWPLRAPTAR